jgi:hypothetical protein
MIKRLFAAAVALAIPTAALAHPGHAANDPLAGAEHLLIAMGPMVVGVFGALAIWLFVAWRRAARRR